MKLGPQPTAKYTIIITMPVNGNVQPVSPNIINLVVHNAMMEGQPTVKPTNLMGLITIVMTVLVGSIYGIISVQKILIPQLTVLSTKNKVMILYVLSVKRITLINPIARNVWLILIVYLGVNNLHGQIMNGSVEFVKMGILRRGIKFVIILLIKFQAVQKEAKNILGISHVVDAKMEKCLQIINSFLMNVQITLVMMHLGQWRTVRGIKKKHWELLYAQNVNRTLD